jgi:hypothetical protein
MSAKTTYHFSIGSLGKLHGCDKRLQLIANRAIDVVDFTVLCGQRSKEEQNELFRLGKSKVNWPNSLHNVTAPDELAKAMDLAPWPIDWTDYKRFYYLGGVVKAIAHEMGIPIRWGGDWDSDNDFNDQDFNDLVHFELEENVQ